MENNSLNTIDQFIESVSKLKNEEDIYTFFEGICSYDELESMSQRLEVARQLMDGKVYSDIVTDTNASALSVNRIDKALQNGGLKDVINSLNINGKSASYGEFAYIYDSLTQNVDYPTRVGYIEQLFGRYGKNPTLVLDLACGTGSASVLLSQKGYDVIAVDSSSDMLDVANQKAKSQGLDILFLCQRMEEFELYGTVDAVVCLLDSLNYITDYNELKKVFALVHNYLNPGGIFIFDINTRHVLKNVFPGGSIVDTDSDEVVYTWESFYDDKEHICEFVLNFFVNNGENYKRFTEIHHQKAYTSANIKSAIELAGLRLVGEFDDLSFDEPKKGSTKVFYVVVKD